MTGRPFQSPSLTVSPKPSRSDFWITTSAARWNALICTLPTCWMFESRWMSRSPAARLLDLLPDLEALGVVGGHRAGEHQLRVGDLLAHDLERLDDADRVLPRVVPADLAHDRAVRVDAVLLADLADERIGQVEVLHRQRVDARRRRDDVVHRRASRGRTRSIVQTDAS